MKRLDVHSAASKRSAALMVLAGVLAATTYGREPGAPNTAAEPAARSSTSLTGVTKNQQSEILLRAARNSVAMGDLAEAFSRFERLLDLTPSDAQARFEYAGLLMQAG